MLAPDGVAALQFDTRPRSALADAVHALPDPLLPRLHSGAAPGATACRRAQLRAWVADAGLVLTAER